MAGKRTTRHDPAGHLRAASARCSFLAKPDRNDSNILDTCLSLKGDGGATPANGGPSGP